MEIDSQAKAVSANQMFLKDRTQVLIPERQDTFNQIFCLEFQFYYPLQFQGAFHRRFHATLQRFAAFVCCVLSAR